MCVCFCHTILLYAVSNSSKQDFSRNYSPEAGIPANLVKDISGPLGVQHPVVEISLEFFLEFPARKKPPSIIFCPVYSVSECRITQFLKPPDCVLCGGSTVLHNF